MATYTTVPPAQSPGQPPAAVDLHRAGQRELPGEPDPVMACDDVSIYYPSFSDWSRDQSCPVVQSEPEDARRARA